MFKRIIKYLQFMPCLIGIYLLILLTEWVINDLVTFRFESSTLNYFMLVLISLMVIGGTPLILFDVYEKWKFLNKLMWDDKRLKESLKHESIKDNERL